MEHRKHKASTSADPELKAPTVSMSQVLWHVCRGDSLAVTAMLTCEPTGHCEVQVAFGTVALQCVRFSSAEAAVEGAAGLLAELEMRGYQRRRRDKRAGPCGQVTPGQLAR